MERLKRVLKKNPSFVGRSTLETAESVNDAGGGSHFTVDSFGTSTAKASALAIPEDCLGVMASQASATQRSGRAGRTSAGVCYRLWSETSESRRPAHWQPEIHRADLAPLLLELGLWGATGSNDLPWIDAPPAASLARAESLLTQLGLWQQGKLTQLGREVAKLPVHPRIGNMLLWAAKHGNIDVACRIAVLMEEHTRGPSSIDLEHLTSRALPSALQRRADQLARLLGIDNRTLPNTSISSNGTKAGSDSPSAAVLLAQAYPNLQLLLLLFDKSLAA